MNVQDIPRNEHRVIDIEDNAKNIILPTGMHIKHEYVWAWMDNSPSAIFDVNIVLDDAYTVVEVNRLISLAYEAMCDDMGAVQRDAYFLENIKICDGYVEFVYGT